MAVDSRPPVSSKDNQIDSVVCCIRRDFFVGVSIVDHLCGRWNASLGCLCRNGLNVCLTFIIKLFTKHIRSDPTRCWRSTEINYRLVDDVEYVQLCIIRFCMFDRLLDSGFCPIAPIRRK
ncbi:hypothetical protein SAMN04487948_1148 [Halogranum amylolyticum]|uniref:Uncharacterized protein n=1 Tax=Halogranum amylolyticum TaxID=660520 RepID=A0A1H8V3G3_9EURY|nr:hypothetical protein SAMN04487948_1148 [Halogranum amylolyticum]